MNVDWRNRNGRSFVTSVRSQGSAPNCWAFAMTALYESMIRIEHNLWTRRSEGDVARGAGKQAWDWGNAGEAHIFVERYGLADPGCFPWSEAASLYTAKPHGSALSALPLSPTPDRAGRTMKIRPGTFVSLTTDKQKKDWLDLVGPTVVQVPIRWDFSAVGSQIYHPNPASPVRGDHLMLVVGFNDDDQCWIVKNSWGTTWGDRGYGRIAYAANMLEPRDFVGVRGTNPDPWAKRRQRTGALVQSGNGGSNNNFELFVLTAGNIEHWYRENANWLMQWNRVGPIRSADKWRPLPADAIDVPAVVQSSLNRNYELMYRCSENSLHHAYFDQATGWWFDAKLVGSGGVALVDAIGIPGFVQSDRGAPGDFEVVAVTRAGTAEHWTKHNSAPWTRLPGEWYRQQVFGRGFGFSGPSLVQSRLGVTGVPENGLGELHYVGATSAGEMQHWRRVPGRQWVLLSTFGSDVTSGPTLIEGTYGAGDDSGIGNFELCVVVGQQVQHWWRHNRSSGPWVLSAEFGDAAARVVGLLQGTYSTNLEAIVQRTDGRYQHYWRDGVGWHAGAVVV
jgi:Papain family cysteine protease